MDTLTEYGYDERIFVSEIPQYFYCSICTLVLKNPIQILRCGHKMCAVCFDRIKTQSLARNTELLCPIDRDLIEVTGVCEDIYLKRIIGDLVVRCYEHEHGCEWNGELRELDNHTVQCSYKPSQQGAVSVSPDRFNQLTNRIEQCESSLLVKDKEIAGLKDLIQEQLQSNKAMEQHQQRYDHLEDQISQLVNRNMELVRNQQEQQRHYEEMQQQFQEEMKLLKELNEGQQREMKVLTDLVKTLHKRIPSQKNGSQNISSSLRSSSCDLGIVPNKQPLSTEVREKNIVVERHSGPLNSGTISNTKHSIHFGGDPSTMSAQNGVVPPGSKSWYEFKCTKTAFSPFSAIRVGWATSAFPSSKEVVWVGSDAKNYGFDVFNVRRYHNRLSSSWGNKIAGSAVASSAVVVGVALDMVKREILFSVDGQWTAPMGVAYSNIPADIKLFPVFSGMNAWLEYNFGDRGFTFGPPDPTFVKLLDAV